MSPRSEPQGEPQSGRSDAPASPSQSLCVECGLCCDGTLFSWAPLDAADDETSLRQAGFTPIEREGGRSLNLPCHHHCGACQIYNDWRPGICGSYRCSLLRRHDAGEVTYDQALEIIRKTTRHAERVREALQEALHDAPGEGAVGPRGALATMYAAWEAAVRDRDPGDWARRHSAFLLEYAGLRRRLGRYFGLPEERERSRD